jgi:hypothetical protein
MSLQRVLLLVGACVAFLVSLVSLPMLIESVDANQIAVIQDPGDGDLHWYTTAGYKWQGFGKVTKYPKRAIYKFEVVIDPDDKTVMLSDTRIKVRFNDGGHADLQGSISYDYPLDDKNLTEIHTKFGSPEAVQAQLVKTVVDKSLYMTGPLMSSKESYSEKRNQLISLVEDQVSNGIVRTFQHEQKVADPITGLDKVVTVVDVLTGTDGRVQRQESPQLTIFGIRPLNFSLTEVRYDATVEGQIQAQQQLTMQVQTAIAQAKQAEQRTITVEKEGEANAAKAKWEQEVLKATAVTEAQQKLEVAKLGATTAEQIKREQILLGEGEAERKRLVMNADGALDKKLDAAIRINAGYADAVKNYQGAWVPSVVMGSGGNAVAGSGAQALVDMLTAKTAIDLGLNMGIAGAANTKR